MLSTKIPSAVLDLNEKFADVMDNGFWFVKVSHCLKRNEI